VWLFTWKLQVKGANVSNQHMLLGSKPQILPVLQVLIPLQTPVGPLQNHHTTERTGIQYKPRHVILDHCLALRTEGRNYTVLTWGLDRNSQVHEK